MEFPTYKVHFTVGERWEILGKTLRDLRVSETQVLLHGSSVLKILIILSPWYRIFSVELCSYILVTFEVSHPHCVDQLYNQKYVLNVWSEHNYVYFTQIATYNYMFRPCILAIIRLYYKFNPLNAELTLRRLMSYIYIYIYIYIWSTHSWCF